jgi:uncharacterized repeat protein (TIGR01451 family)
MQHTGRTALKALHESRLSRLSRLLLVSLFWFSCAAALASEPVTNTLAVHRVVTDPSGKESLASADTARPGDVLEYVASYHNQGPSVAHGLVATLPLPVGTEWVSEEAHPSATLASLDGNSFSAIPLKRTVRLADGSSRQELVPLREYRALRWAPTDLGASGDYSVSARVKITPVAANP